MYRLDSTLVDAVGMGEAAAHPPDKRILKEMGESNRGLVFVLLAL